MCMPADTGKIEKVLRDGTLTVEASGSWTIKTASILGAIIDKLAPTSGTAALIEFCNLEAIDTGAFYKAAVSMMWDHQAQAFMPAPSSKLTCSHASFLPTSSLTS